MKKSCLFILALCLAKVFCFSDDWNKDKYYSIPLDCITGSSLYVTPEYEGVLDRETRPLKITKIPSEDFYLNDNGYFYFKNRDYYYIDRRECPEYIVIFKNDAFTFFFDKNDLSSENPDYVDYYKSNNAYYNSKYGTVYKASSVLIENTKNGKVFYNASNLGTALFPKDCRESFPTWNYEQKPYAEGKSGYGIGETISISTKEAFSSLTVLNGYVSVSNLSLYKKNSRVKTFVVKDLDNKVEYEVELDDVVMFQNIYFEKPTKNVTLEIKDVYKGDKWDDTCISAIIPDNDKPRGKFNYKKQTQNYSEQVLNDLSILE